MPKIIILVGPPCSGKNYWLDKRKEDLKDYYILSCDDIRNRNNPEKYIFDKKKEDAVWEEFYNLLKGATSTKANIVINNTNCRLAYIDKILSLLPEEYSIYYKYFDTPLWLLYLRNYWRRYKTGKWIPNEVIRNMRKNFKKLRRNDTI